jgi:hypothetical protein
MRFCAAFLPSVEWSTVAGFTLTVLVALYVLLLYFNPARRKAMAAAASTNIRKGLGSGIPRRFGNPCKGYIQARTATVPKVAGRTPSPGSSRSPSAVAAATEGCSPAVSCRPVRFIN